MVNTAIFSTFHRLPAAPEPAHSVQPAPEPFNDDAAGAPAVDREDALGAEAAAAPPARPEQPSEAPPPLEAPRDTQESSLAAPEIAWRGLPVDHDFLSLANPAICSVSASLSPGDDVEISAIATGLYRPADFRAAPWSGFAYDVAPDRRTGLLAGTRILTARGEIAVENLLPGDTALALRGPAMLPILWIGRCVALEPPVVIDAGALGDQRPNRSLCVAADHPIFVEPVPVQAKRLVNGTTIRTLELETAELFHIDVGRQEVLFAQNVPLASTQRPAADLVE